MTSLKRKSRPSILRLSELAKMSESDKQAALTRLAELARAPGDGFFILERIMEYEEEYGMTSEMMRRALANEEIEETSDIAKWLMLLSVHARTRNPK